MKETPKIPPLNSNKAALLPTRFLFVVAPFFLLNLAYFTSLVISQLEKQPECLNLMKQCGGLNYVGSNDCCYGLDCIYINDYWWECKCKDGNCDEYITGQNENEVDNEEEMTSNDEDQDIEGIVQNVHEDSDKPSVNDNEESETFTEEDQCKRFLEQCDGENYRGSSSCCEGLECVKINQYWSQCDIIGDHVGNVEDPDLIVDIVEGGIPTTRTNTPTVLPTVNPENAENDGEKDDNFTWILPEAPISFNESNSENRENSQKESNDDDQNASTPSALPKRTPHPTISPALWLPTPQPTVSPTAFPTAITNFPSLTPSSTPTKEPTSTPSEFPTKMPTFIEWTSSPTSTPGPTRRPRTRRPTPSPTPSPTSSPTKEGETYSPTPEPPPAPWELDRCYRVRKNFLALSEEEKNIYYRALQKLKDNGVYDNIAAMHANAQTFSYYHANDYFLPWHRYYIYKLESAVRALGGEFQCFSLPYWDWTMDAGNERHSKVWDFVGPLGDKSRNYCMDDGPFSNFKNAQGRCLRRIGTTYRFFGPAEVMKLILKKPKYSPSGFRSTFEVGAHARPHLFISGDMNTFASANDPVFFLHHTYVDLIWAMWQDCYNYENKRDITQEQFPKTMVDRKLYGFKGQTTRKVWDIRDMKYTYEFDYFADESFISESVCDFNLFKKGFNRKSDGVTDDKTKSDFINGTPKHNYPPHALTLLEEENYLYEKCLNHAISNDMDILEYDTEHIDQYGNLDQYKIETSSTTSTFEQDCVDYLAAYECNKFGPICEPPQDWLQKMGMERDWQETATELKCVQRCDEESNSI